jgi:hypothetical protein
MSGVPDVGWNESGYKRPSNKKNVPQQTSGNGFEVMLAK